MKTIKFFAGFILTYGLIVLLAQAAFGQEKFEVNVRSLWHPSSDTVMAMIYEATIRDSVSGKYLGTVQRWYIYDVSIVLTPRDTLKNAADTSLVVRNIKYALKKADGNAIANIQPLSPENADTSMYPGINTFSVSESDKKRFLEWAKSYWRDVK